MLALTRFGQLCGLASFAIAAPLLDLLAREGGFFVAHGLGPTGIVSLMLAVLLAPPLGLWLLGQGATLVGPGSGRRFHVGALSGLFALTLLPPLHRFFDGAGGVPIAIAGALCILFALAYSSSQAVRTLASLSGLAPLVTAILFLSQPEVRAFWGTATPLMSEPADTASLRGPVIVVIFDEIPLSSLLDGAEEIDGVRYPGFAALAETSIWFRGISAVSTSTQEAVPAILSGRYPLLQDSLPIFSLYPNNLFSLLSPTHRLNIHETLTQLRPPAEGFRRKQVEGRVAERQATRSRDCLAEDLALLYAHLLAPLQMRERLPPVDQDWRCWWRRDADLPDSPSPAFRGEGQGGASQSERRAWIELRQRDAKGDNDHPEMFRSFVRSIPTVHALRKPGQGSLHFIHLAFPHTPWRYTPSGTPYAPSRLHGNAGERWSMQAWWSLEAYQRHLLQLGLADRLLGELLESLRSNQLFDEALIVVTSDHGVGFWPGEKRRSVDDGAHPEDILNVPLFIKRPHQSDPQRNDSIGESVDILPSIADLLGAKIVWEIDGCSLFEVDCPERRVRHAMVADGSRGRVMREFPVDIVDRKSTLERKLEFFGSGRLIPSLYRFGPFGELVGERASQLELRMPAAGNYRRGRRPGRGASSNVRVSLQLKLDSELESVPYVAIALNDVIETVVPAPRDSRGRRLIVAMLPEEHLKGDDDRIELYLVEAESTESSTMSPPPNVSATSSTGAPEIEEPPSRSTIWLRPLSAHR